MSAPDRANDPRRRFVRLTGKNEVHSNYYGAYAALPKGSYKISDNNVIDVDTDEEAQIAFREKGYNKGKAGDMAKNLNERVEKSIPETHPASKNYDPTPF